MYKYIKHSETVETIYPQLRFRFYWVISIWSLHDGQFPTFFVLFMIPKINGMYIQIMYFKSHMRSKLEEEFILCQNN